MRFGGINRKATETRDVVTFELPVNLAPVWAELPKRQIVALNTCQWIYRSSERSYTGTDYYDVNGNEVSTEVEDVCKRIASASCGLRKRNAAVLDPSWS